jgi:hypothetical protein
MEDQRSTQLSQLFFNAKSICSSMRNPEDTTRMDIPAHMMMLETFNEKWADPRLYTEEFVSVVELTEDRRVDLNDAQSQWLLDFQRQLRTGDATRDDWIKICENCSRDTMLPAEWVPRGFNQPQTTCLYCTNDEVRNYNNQCLLDLTKRIALIKASHTGKAKSMIPEDFYGLQLNMYLAVGALVFITTNLRTVDTLPRPHNLLI